MSTNYYWHEHKPCPTCGTTAKPQHIGKSSAGWCFALRVYPEDGINDLCDWQQRWESRGYIADEHGRRVAPADMTMIIMMRSWWKREFTDEEVAANHAKRGPAGLLRHTRHARPGAGTWDLVDEEFS